MLVALAASSSAAASNYGWLSGLPTVQQAKTIDNIQFGRCPYVINDYEIEGEQGRRPVCINPSGSVRIGYYDESRSTRFVIGFGRDSYLYHLEGVDCDHSCVYSPQTDTFITRQYLINGLVKSLVIYDKFSTRLERITIPLYAGYKIANTSSPYIFQSSNGYPYPVNGLGLSANGEYLGIEARGRGFLTLDLTNMNLKRISSYAYSYGYGIDPSVEIAVSDDGDNFAAVGVNASIKLYSGLRQCGDDPSDAHIMDLVPMSEYDRCPEVNINTDSFIYRFRDATSPKFSYSGLGLSFFANSYVGENKFVNLSAFGSKNYSLDLLGFGDSFTSGEGETDDLMYMPNTNSKNEKCHTSKRSYPYLLPDTYFLPSLKVKSVACSGALTDDILGYSSDGYYTGQGNRLQTLAGNDSNYLAELRRDALAEFIPGRIGQIDFAREYNPKIIIVSVGGNDLDLVGKLRACIQKVTCSYAVDLTEQSKLLKQMNQLYFDLRELYATIKSINPQATLYAVGYPQVISADGYCDPANHLFFNDKERLFMRSTISFMNQNIEAAAKWSGVKYVDIEDVYGDATLCGTAKELAMNGLTGGDDVLVVAAKVIGNESFHPRPLGHRLVANRIFASYPNMFDTDYCLFSPADCVSDNGPPPPPAYWPQDIDPEIAKLTVEHLTNLVAPADSSGRARTINLSSYSLQPGSTAVVAVHSDIIELGKFTAASDGSLGVDIELPADLDYGYHIITVNGLSYSGEPIEYRQQILLLDPTAIVLTASPAQSSSQNAVENVSNVSSTESTTVSSGLGPVVGDPAVLGVSDEKSINLTKTPTKSEVVSTSSMFWLVCLGLGALLVSAPTAYLLIRRARNTIKT